MVVEFQETLQCEPIPTIWLIGRNRCRFPAHLSAVKCDSAVRQRANPEEHWEQFDIKVVASSSTFNRAQSKRELYMRQKENFQNVVTEPSDTELGAGKRKSK